MMAGITRGVPGSRFVRWVVCGIMLASVTPASADIKRVRGQTIYVPAYSHIYHGDREVPFYLTVTLSIRNTDRAHPLRIVSVGYFDQDGRLIKNHLESELKLSPLASTRFVIKESDRSGGSGASFIVKWKSDASVTAPVTETVMVSTATQQGISFTSRGQVIEED